MSPAERQAARRLRLGKEVAELQRTVEAQAREIEELRRMTTGDDETQMLIRNILVGNEGGHAGLTLRLMRKQLLGALALVRRVEDAMERVKVEMYEFAIGGKSMNRETRKAVFAEICAIDEAARRARKSLLEGQDGPPAWARGERDWR
jgi:hypothetical protein